MRQFLVDMPKDIKLWKIDDYLETVLKADPIFLYLPQ